MYLRQRIAAISSKTGERAVVEVWGHQIAISTLEGHSSTREGLPELWTEGRRGRVNRLQKGRYEIVQTGEILESGDPDAF